MKRPFSLAGLFIARPVSALLLAVAVMLAGAVAYRDLPTAPLPEVDFPSIVIEASLPGANPRTMAAAVAAPLERALGSIAGVTELVDRPAVDCYGAPLPPKHPAYDRGIRASTEADEATTAEATEEAANHDD